ncbi:MAG: Crp/Fnr family transcriptional regulator [Anaerovoracaceae bacterium]
MKNNFVLLKNNPLFAGIGIDDFDKMLNCLGGKTTSYKKGNTILLAGNPVDSVGLILQGSVKILREDVDGHTHILSEFSAPELFGETFACASVDHSPVSVIATEDCDILFLNYRKIITTCSSSCVFHGRLIENMLTLIAQKNLILNRKIEILSKRTIRERLMLFLENQCDSSRKCTIPYNREELAALLCVDRSAMSNELSKMQKDKLIRFSKNHFEIL